MFAPHTVKQEYGVTLDDIDLEYYDDMVANPNIEKKKKDAREMLNTIAQTQLQSDIHILCLKTMLIKYMRTLILAKSK